MRTIFQWLRWVCLLLLGLAWTKTSSFAAVGALNQANGGLTIRYDATETQNRGYDAEPSRAWDNNPPEMVDASAFFGSPAQFLAAKGTVSLDSSAIRFSQSNVRSSLPEITQSMRANGWQGAPIDVVRMADGGLTTVDNTRLAAASLSGTRVQAVVRNFDDVFPAGRAGGNLQGGTWGEALMNRIGGQKPTWQRTYPSGSPFTGVHPSTPGFTP